MCILIVQAHREILVRLWIYVLDLHTDLSACQLLAEDGSLLEGINLSVGVYTALKTIAGSVLSP